MSASWNNCLGYTRGQINILAEYQRRLMELAALDAAIAELDRMVEQERQSETEAA